DFAQVVRRQDRIIADIVDLVLAGVGRIDRAAQDHGGGGATGRRRVRHERCDEAVRLVAAIPWTLPAPGGGDGSLFVDAFRHAGLDLPRAGVVTYTNPARSALAANGRFLTIVPESVLRFAVTKPAIKALPIDLPTTRRSVAIVTVKNRTLNPTAQLFVDCAREVAGSLAKRKP